MALTDESGGGIPATMLVGPANIGGASMPYPYPMMMGGQGNGGFGNGQDGWWIVLLIIILAAAGNGFGGNNNGGGAFGGGQPIIINDGQSNGGAVQRGFDQAAVMSGIGAIQSGVQALSTQLCSCCCDMQNTVNQGFFGTQNALNAGFNNAETSANARQMANMQQAFAAQTAMAQGFSGVNAGVADLRYTVATEACADRAAVGDALQNVTMQNVGNTNQIVNAITAGIQSIKDDLCADRLDAERRENQNLRTQLSMAQLAASQTAQTAQIERGQLAATTALVNELRSCPIPSQPVYGSQPIFTCPNNNNGCGCGCNSNF